MALKHVSLRRGAAGCVLLALAACSDTHETTQQFPTGPLKPGMVARVGSVEVSGKLVKQVAEARKVSPSSAAKLLVDDALLAQAAHDQKLDADLHVAAKVRAVQARMTIDQLLNQQPIRTASDEQVAQMTSELWVQVDRGPALRTVHAVVLSKEYSKEPAAPDTPEENAHRVALAEKMRDAGLRASNAADFMSLANAIPTEGLQVTVEALPPIVEDGRTFDGQSLATEFAKGAFAIPEGEHLSGIVQSDFGWHVIYVAERLPAVHQSMEERRALATRIIAEKTMKADYEAHLVELRKQMPVEISQAATTDIMSTLSPSAPSPP